MIANGVGFEWTAVKTWEERIPALFVVGESDGVLPPVMRRTHEAVARSEFLSIPRRRPPAEYRAAGDTYAGADAFLRRAVRAIL